LVFDLTSFVSNPTALVFDPSGFISNPTVLVFDRSVSGSYRGCRFIHSPYTTPDVSVPENQEAS
jgi:hypothetical protein